MYPKFSKPKRTHKICNAPTADMLVEKMYMMAAVNDNSVLDLKRIRKQVARRGFEPRSQGF